MRVDSASGSACAARRHDVEAGEGRHRCWGDVQPEKGWRRSVNERCVKNKGREVKIKKKER